MGLRYVSRWEPPTAWAISKTSYLIFVVSSVCQGGVDGHDWHAKLACPMLASYYNWPLLSLQDCHDSATYTVCLFHDFSLFCSWQYLFNVSFHISAVSMIEKSEMYRPTIVISSHISLFEWGLAWWLSPHSNCYWSYACEQCPFHFVMHTSQGRRWQSSCCLLRRTVHWLCDLSDRTVQKNINILGRGQEPDFSYSNPITYIFKRLPLWRWLLHYFMPIDNYYYLKI